MDLQKKLVYFKEVQRELSGDLAATALRMYASVLITDINEVIIDPEQEWFTKKKKEAVMKLQDALKLEINQAVVSERANKTGRSNEKYLAANSDFMAALSAIDQPLADIIIALEQLLVSEHKPE